MGVNYTEGKLSNVHFSLVGFASGSLNVRGLSTPFLEYSLHLRAAEAALLALSATSSSAKQLPFENFIIFYN